LKKLLFGAAAALLILGTCAEAGYDVGDYPIMAVASFRKTDVAPNANSVTLSPGTGGTLTADKAAAVEGEIVTVIYAPDNGYELEAIWGYRTGNESVTVPLSYSSGVCTFTMPAYSVTVRASFKITSAPATYPVIVSESIVGGSVTADKAYATPGETVTLVSFPNTGYRVDAALAYNADTQAEWMTLYFNGNVCQFTMPAYPATIFVSFTRTSGSTPTPGKTYKSSSGGGCNVSVSGMGIFIWALTLTGAALLRKNRR
jgi:hypothetical protein